MNQYHARARRLREDKPKGDTRRLVRRIAGLFRPFRLRFAALGVLTVLVAALDLLPILLIERIVDALTEHIAAVQAGEPAPDTAERVTVLFALGLAMYVASGLLNVLAGYLNQVIGQGLMYNLRRDLHRHLQRMGVRFFTATKTGEILSRITTDVNQIQEAVTNTFSEFLRNAVTLALAVGVMFVLDWRLALIAAVVLPLWALPTLKVGQLMRRLRLEWQEEAGRMTGHLEETLSVSGLMLVKSFGRQDHEARRFDDSNEQLRQLSIRRLMAGRWFNMGTELFGYVSVLVVWWVGGLLVVNGAAELSVVTAFSVVVVRVFTPFRMISRINTNLLTSLALFERIFEYLDMKVEVDERPGARDLANIRGDVAFEHVTFRYVPDNPPALVDVSFEAPRGTMVALVGPSGAGKTTTAYMLQRFYDPTEGRVTLDGHDLRDLTFATVSRGVGAVMQDTYLFHTSLRENIRYGRLEATDAEIDEAAAAAGLGDLIERLPRGLDTVVGERGYRLSGGEKQRVAIARAVLKDAPVLVLDEATASLDSKLEREIREATARLAEGRTTVVIAHRLSTVMAADLILVFQRGRIVERGRHEELLALGGLYAQLYHEQFEPEAAAIAAEEMLERPAGNGPVGAAGRAQREGASARAAE